MFQQQRLHFVDRITAESRYHHHHPGVM